MDDRGVKRGRQARAFASLPDPPTDAEKASYGDRGILLILTSSLISFSALLISQIKFAFISPLIAAVFAPFVGLTLLYYGLSLCMNIGTRGFDMRAHRALARSWQPASYPSLDVFLPVCGEPTEILDNTWLNVARLAVRYPGRVTVYVLDDGASAEVETMAGDFGFTYLVRPNRGWMKKAGNLRHGFACSGGEFILLLDADFAPRADLPLEVLPYFFADPTLGIVQTPQFFRTEPAMSWMERGAGAVQEFFYRLLQVSLDNYGNAVCVGTCAIYRRAALEVNGGTTPIHHSEDIHTGFDLFRAGWGTRYVPVPLSTGLSPSSPDSFLAQQYRWCSGSMSLLGARKFWITRMRWQARCGYLAGFFYYWYTALFVVVGPLICLLLLAAMPGQVELANYALILPSIMYDSVIFPAWHRCKFGPEAYMTKMLYGWAHLFSLWDMCRGREMGWQATGESGVKSGIRRIWRGIAIWGGGTSIVWVVLAGWRVYEQGGKFIPLLILGLAECLITGMALASPRDHVRKRGAEPAPAPVSPALREPLRVPQPRSHLAEIPATVTPRPSQDPEAQRTLPVAVQVKASADHDTAGRSAPEPRPASTELAVSAIPPASGREEADRGGVPRPRLLLAVPAVGAARKRLCYPDSRLRFVTNSSRSLNAPIRRAQLHARRSNQRGLLILGIIILTMVMVTGLAYPLPAGNRTAPWQRIWSGDFDGPAGPVNSRIWRYQTGQGIFGTGEIEVTTNRVQNVHLDGHGELDIAALRQDGEWTSGRIISRRAFTPPAGREVMVTATLRQPDLSRGVGYWPAFWMLGLGTWPAHGEIDILEDINALGKHSGTLHCGNLTSPNPGGTSGPCHEPTGRSSGMRPCPGCQTGYHSYSVIVDRRHPGHEQIRWYLDNREFFSVSEGQVGRQPWDEAIHHGFNIIFDLAIGGSFPDVVCHCLSPLASTQSGGTLHVRSVAVYQN